MAEETGFEPAISGLTGRRVKPLRYTSVLRSILKDKNLFHFLIIIFTNKNGGRNRARTCDPLLVRQVLSQLSYSPICSNKSIITASAITSIYKNTVQVKI